MRLLADLITWLFAFDDRCDEDELGANPGRLAPALAPLLEVVDRFGTTADAGYQPAGPTAAALHDLCRRIRALGQPGGLLRFSAAFREYLFALLWEATNRQLRRVPRFAEYVQMRRHTGAVLPSFALTDIATDGLAATVDRVDPRVVRLDLLAADLVCWCNDVFSYGKERLRDGHNLATVIAYELSWPERAALTEAAARYNAGLAAYGELEAEVLADADDRLSRMLRSRRRWLRGTYDWSLELPPADRTPESRIKTLVQAMIDTYAQGLASTASWPYSSVATVRVTTITWPTKGGFRICRSMSLTGRFPTCSSSVSPRRPTRGRSATRVPQVQSG